ncbi:MAG TPA: NAD kinase [Burkholderiales bacterium]|jgi:NAD+ kinase
MKSAFKTVALVGKYKSPEVAAPLLKLARFLERRKVEVLMDRVAGSRAGRGRYPALSLEELARKADLAIVIGGDGTMLNIARTLAPQDVALVGVSQGRLGFLTDISVENMVATIGAILDGKFVAEKRMLLEGRVRSKARETFRALAFNDVVVSKGARGNLIELEVRIDGEFMYNQRSDGLIVATPTGSTAYAMSAGGPIVHPALSVMALVPVSPHTLSNRPIVVSSDSVVDVIVRGAADPRVHFDSHTHFNLREGDCVTVRRYSHTIRLLHPAKHSYYTMLREKLNWYRE